MSWLDTMLEAGVFVEILVAESWIRQHLLWLILGCPKQQMGIGRRRWREAKPTNEHPPTASNPPQSCQQVLPAKSQVGKDHKIGPPQDPVISKKSRYIYM